LFAVLLILSDVSVFIKPAYLWFFPFLGLMFPYLLIVNFGFLLFWAFKRRKTLLISLLAIVLSFNNIRASFQMSISKGSNAEILNTPGKIKVLSYNVRLFNSFEGTDFKKSREKILRFIEKEKPDIICFQEFFAENGALPKNGYLSLFLDKKFNYCYYTARIYNNSYGMVTLSRYPIIKRKAIKFEGSYNQTIYTDIVIEQDTVRVFNNHLQSIRFLKNNYDFIDTFRLEYSDKQVRELKDISRKLRKAFIMRSQQVREVAALIKKTRYPVIVCGDFNDTPVSYTYRTMSSGLNDAFMEAGNGIGNTYNGIFPSYRIDYILHSKSFTTLSYETGKLATSDHYPVTAVLVLDK